MNEETEEYDRCDDCACSSCSQRENCNMVDCEYCENGSEMHPDCDDHHYN